MSRIHSPATSRLQKMATNPAMVAFAVALALAGCANKKNLPNSAGELGLGAEPHVLDAAQRVEPAAPDPGDVPLAEKEERAERADLAALALDPAEWAVEIVETRDRRVPRPAGEAHGVRDGVLVLRRAAVSEDLAD